jgi:hypothetical protein
LKQEVKWANAEHQTVWKTSTHESTLEHHGVIKLDIIIGRLHTTNQYYKL